MRSRWFHTPTLHTEHHEEKKVSWLELFFDLVFVAAAIQLGDALSYKVTQSHSALVPMLHFAGYFVALWWAWNGFTFFANRFTIDDFTHRLIVFLNMFAIGAMAMTAPKAMQGESSRPFSIAFAVSLGLIALLWFRAWRHEKEARSLARQGVIMFGGAAVLWLVSVAVPMPYHYILWALGIGLLMVSPTLPVWRQLNAKYPIDLEHLAERFGLLTIIVLGESFVKVLSYAASSPYSLELGFISNSLLTLLITCCIWWIYFDDVADAHIRKRKGSVPIWFFSHLPLTLGITMVGVGLKKLISLDMSVAPPAEYRWLLGGALAITFMSVAIIDSVTERKNVLLSDALRIKVRLLAAFLVILAAAAGDTATTGLFIAIMTGLCLTQVLFDVFMAPFEADAADAVTITSADLIKSHQETGRVMQLGGVRDFARSAVRLNVPSHMRRDLYFFFMEGSWTQLMILSTAFYLIINLVFGALFLLEPGSIGGGGAETFGDAFAFSVQTITTIGYGSMTPATAYGDFLVAVEALIGILGIAFLTGLVFAKASRPQPGILFSAVMVITRRNDKPTLVFRAGNVRGSEIVDATVNVAAIVDEITAEGRHMGRSHYLKLVTHQLPLFALSWNVMHIIDEDSPLYGLDPTDLAARLRAVVVTLAGHDGTYGQHVTARMIYAVDDIRPGHHFVDVMGRTDDGRVILDFAKFHDIEPDAGHEDRLELEGEAL